MALSATETAIRANESLVESLAERLSRRHRDERDDLIQEGLISVWQSAAAGQAPTEASIEKRMRAWLRLRGRQRRETPTDYDKAMKLSSEEELRAVNAQAMATRRLPGHGPDAAE